MGDETHLAGKDRILEDGVGVYPVDEHDLALFEAARQDLARLPVPILLHDHDPHARLYVAAFDDRGNDDIDGRAPDTSIGPIAERMMDAGATGQRSIIAGHVADAGTQAPWPGRTGDGASGRAYAPCIEEMYEKLVRQAREWRREDPRARIGLAGIGFGRGAEQVVAFARLVHERGIRDPSDIRRAVDDSGPPAAGSARPPLVPPGQVAQVVGLLDPAGGGEPRQDDRRLPPSVISGFQVIAADELRGPPRSAGLIDPGMTVDGRFLAVLAAGAHSDIGGGHHRNGLSIRAGNLLLDYLDALADAPLLEKRPEPTGPGVNVVHLSNEGMLLQRVWRKVDRQQVSGVAETPAPAHARRIVADCPNAEARDEALASGFEYRRAAIGKPSADAARLDPPLRVDATVPGHPDHALLVQGVAATGRLEDRLHRVRDLSTDRLATILVEAAKRAELQRIDHVVLSDTGSHAFAVEGDLDSPFRRVARTATNSAINTPVGDTLARIGTVALASVRERPHGRPDASRPATGDEAPGERDPASPRTLTR
ncbi:MAG TPA: XVIPCD domain-containing protein [Luteimonas sp.]|nr:XVIPCD domain-containing protein [Luteimonas sp.]